MSTVDGDYIDKYKGRSGFYLPGIRSYKFWADWRAALHPWQGFIEYPRFSILEYQKVNDPLHPSRATLRVRRHDNVAGSRPIVLPPTTIGVPRSILSKWGSATVHADLLSTCSRLEYSNRGFVGTIAPNDSQSKGYQAARHWHAECCDLSGLDPDELTNVNNDIQVLQP